jgi:hypothetical protein
MVSGQWLVINGMTRASSFSDRSELMANYLDTCDAVVGIILIFPLIAIMMYMRVEGYEVLATQQWHEQKTQND